MRSAALVQLDLEDRAGNDHGIHDTVDHDDGVADEEAIDADEDVARAREKERDRELLVPGRARGDFALHKEGVHFLLFQDVADKGEDHGGEAEEDNERGVALVGGGDARPARVRRKRVHVLWERSQIFISCRRGVRAAVYSCGDMH